MASSRRSRRRPNHAGHVPLDLDRLQGMARTERGPGGRAYSVRRVRGSEKEFRCPGCNQLIATGTGHVVAWPQDHIFGEDAALAERRHWHTGC